MTDDQAPAPRYGEMRPRPQYGEYATPQDQAKAFARSLPPVSDALVAPPAPPPGPPVSGQAPRQDPRSASRPLPGVGAKSRRWDVILTAILLGYATITVLSQLFAGSSLTASMNQFYELQGIGTYDGTAQSAQFGTALDVITLLLFLATVLLTTRQLRRGRISFWIPVVGGVVNTIVTLVFIVVLLVADPTFATYMNGIGK